MKKILYSVLAIAMAAFTFTSCEDVPAPYDDPNGNITDEPVTIEPEGDGTEANPYNVAAIIAEAEKLSSGEESDENYYIKGIVTSITENYDGGYGNATYYISDDEDATNSFYIYRSKYFGNTSYTSGVLLEYGDTVVIYGKITNYNGTYETSQNSSYLISINGVTNGEQGSDDDQPGTSGEGLATITKSGTTITMVDPNATPSGNTITCTLDEYGWENASDPEPITLSDGTTIVFAQEDGNNAPKYYSATKGVRMYALNSMTITGYSKIAQVVLTCDSYSGTDYTGNEQLYTEINENTWKMVNDWTGNSGGTQVRVQTIEITYAE